MAVSFFNGSAKRNLYYASGIYYKFNFDFCDRNVSLNFMFSRKNVKVLKLAQSFKALLFFFIPLQPCDKISLFSCV